MSRPPKSRPREAVRRVRARQGPESPYREGLPPESEAREHLRQIMERLAIGQDQAGRIFSVSGETVRRWLRGQSIPLEQVAVIESAAASMRRLAAIFLPERLPVVIRRPAGLFDGRAALDWILDSRIREVADRYELTFAYQG